MATMPPETALSVTEALCERRAHDHVRDKLQIACVRRGNNITISERRPPWRVDLRTGMDRR